ncbi:MAG: hypothetical protein RSB29_06120 [Alistipes sp.]
MKNKITNLLVALFAIFICFSCSDDDNEGSNNLKGVWNYNGVHFVMEFEKEEIPLPKGMTLKTLLETMGLKTDNLGSLGELTSIPAKMLVTNFSEYANVKMGKYFRGLEFTSDYDFLINIVAKGQNKSVAATYAMGKNALYVELDKESVKQAFGKEVAIPSLQYDYTLSDNQLVLFTDKTKIETIVTLLSVMAGDNAIPARKEYIMSILKQTKKLEFGITMKR